MFPALASVPASARPVRVMVVDDVALVRGLIDHWLREEPGFAVVALAANGGEALDRLESARPDIVLLDVEMPGLDGRQVLTEILARRPETRVVMVSTLTRRNAEISLRCLVLGAADYVTKPSSRRDLAGSTEFRRELVARLHALAPGRDGGSTRHGVAPPAVPIPRRRGCVLIGASTGGPKAILQVARSFGQIAGRAPILIAQHMPPLFTPAFAEQIAGVSGLPCAEARHGERVGPGRVYLAPGGRNMGLDLKGGETTIRLDDAAGSQSWRPSVDTLFGDGARIYAARAVGIVLTGMGTDGTEGARALVGSGGTVLVQDSATSTVWGMPGSVVRAGLTCTVVPLGSVASALRDCFGGRP